MSNQLFFLSLADIFSVYPQIFREIITNEENRRKEEGKLAKDHIYLPSDEEWQRIVYYRLLDVQKKINQALESGMTLEQITRRTEGPVFDPSFVIEKFSPSTTPNGRFDERKRCVPDYPIEYINTSELGTWTLENICKAAKLLKDPPAAVEFVNEHEMRKVYSLIYDVFRYKVVMSKALKDTGFYAQHPDLVGHDNRVWLMLFELFSRHFLKRRSQLIHLQDKLYRDAEVYDIADSLWKHKVHLAAAISRMRIRKGALQLSQLLPDHLQNEKVAIATANPIVSGWINPFILENKSDADLFLATIGLTLAPEDGADTQQPQLEENQYKWDKMCPLFLSILPRNRSSFAQSEFIRRNFFIMQDRTFAIAPAVVSQLFDHFELEGDIVQTHVSSPRSTAYLASLFRSVSRVRQFLAYGCGTMLDDYKLYMKCLGIRNVHLFAESFTSIPLESPKFNAVVGIFATPPNSFSAVSDPIDLICSRGGDLNMLEVMTESEISSDGRKRVTQILEEQRETLRMAMSRPQVQFVLYLTHSVVDCENVEMVQMAVENVNRNAFEKHLFYYKEKKRLEALAEAEAAAIPMLMPRKRLPDATSSATTSKTDDSQQAKRRLESRENSFTSDDSSTEDGAEDFTQVINVPKCDQFEIANIPDVCLNQDSCLNMANTGCYISLVQRKQITRLNAKYLIQMAEGRGLFGKGDRDKTRALKKQEKSEAKKPVETKPSKVKRGDDETLLERLMKPTLASKIRSNLSRMSSARSKYLKSKASSRECSRFSLESNYPRARWWWLDSIRYIQALQRRSRRLKSSQAERYNIATLMKHAVHPLHLPSRGRRPGISKEPYPLAINFLNFSLYHKPGVFSKHQILGNDIDPGYWTA